MKALDPILRHVSQLEACALWKVPSKVREQRHLSYMCCRLTCGYSHILDRATQVMLTSRVLSAVADGALVLFLGLGWTGLYAEQR